ncbi:Zn-ribbon domain-containing OB-fold protein [Pseudorhodoferax sp. Leaf267]|uniref:Zn-ribbon domain-containing OB-fold protein n=1 Tax=Pseudorhodoferax sp. Leaf267 TaxID=1736316 RepID=UPI0006FEEE68|nr:OB-fold domain-containing protein [Pseudorhodoferax sp. Leaf267]KQP15146.1 DNA-binding protein [Pseudorhodoferax sp. Leaf267]
MTTTATHPYTDGLAQGLLRYQRCDDCGRAQTLTRLACAHCGSEHLAWHEAQGRGTVVAASVVSRAPSDAFRPLVPYTLVLVELDEGPRVMGHAMPGTTIGDHVKAGTFAHEKRSLLRFSPAAH